MRRVIARFLLITQRLGGDVESARRQGLRRLARAFLALAGGALLAASFLTIWALTRDCTARGACQLGARSYGVQLPAGPGPHPVVVFLPGSLLSGEVAVTVPALSEPARARGYILLAPTASDIRYAGDVTGPGWRWDGAGFAEDQAFIDAALSDLSDRVAVDPTRVLVAGYSSGGILALQMACQGPGVFTAFATLNAAFRAHRPTGCGPQTAAFDLFHHHGAQDPVIPLAGGGPQGGMRWRATGDWFAAIAAAMGCEVPQMPATNTTLQAEGCRSGTSLTVRIAEGDHLLPQDWMADALDWFEALQGPL